MSSPTIPPCKTSRSNTDTVGDMGTIEWSHPPAPPSLEHRQGDARTGDLAPILLAGSSAFLASVAMNLLFLESNPSQPRECPRGWEDGSSVGMGCVWAEAKGRGVNQVLNWEGNKE